MMEESGASCSLCLPDLLGGRGDVSCPRDELLPKLAVSCPRNAWDAVEPEDREDPDLHNMEDVGLGPLSDDAESETEECARGPNLERQAGAPDGEPPARATGPSNEPASSGSHYKQ